MTKTNHAHPLWQLLDRLQMDISSMNAKLTEVRTIVTGLELRNAVLHNCPQCGATQRTVQGLAEHVYLRHDGPLPPHYARAEQLAGITTEEA